MKESLTQESGELAGGRGWHFSVPLGFSLARGLTELLGTPGGTAGWGLLSEERLIPHTEVPGPSEFTEGNLTYTRRPES